MTECGLIFNRHKWKSLGYGFQACSKCGEVVEYYAIGCVIKARQATLADWRKTQAEYQAKEESKKLTLTYLNQK